MSVPCHVFGLALFVRHAPHAPIILWLVRGVSSSSTKSRWSAARRDGVWPSDKPVRYSKSSNGSGGPGNGQTPSSRSRGRSRRKVPKRQQTTWLPDHPWTNDLIMRRAKPHVAQNSHRMPNRGRLAHCLNPRRMPGAKLWNRHVSGNHQPVAASRSCAVLGCIRPGAPIRSLIVFVRLARNRTRHQRRSGYTLQYITDDR